MANSRRFRTASVAALSVAGVAGMLVAWSVPVGRVGAVPAPRTATPTVAITSVVDGSAPFSSADGPGEDSSAVNGRARSGDIVRVGARVVPNGEPGAAAGTLTADDVTVRVTATDGLLTWSAGQPSGCLADVGGVTCSLGRRPVGTPIDVVVEARGAERAVVGDLAGQISVSSGGTPATRPLVVTTGPLTVDATLTEPRFAGTTNRDGVDGVLVTYGVHLQGPDTVGAVSVPEGATFDLLVDASAGGAGATVASCSANGEPGGGHVYGAAVSGAHTAPDVAPSARLAAGGSWTCTPEGQRARVTVAGVDTNPESFPSTAWDQRPLPAGAGVISAGALTLFVPVDTVVAEGSVGISLSPVAGRVAGVDVHGTCGDVDTLAAGGCGPVSTRQDPAGATSVGTPTPRLTVLHTVDAALAAEGAPLVWTTLVTNTGTVTLADVAATVGTVPGTAVAGSPAAAPEPLAPGESWTTTTTGTQPAGTLISTATVTATPAGGDPLTAISAATSATPAPVTVATRTTPEVVTVAGQVATADPVAVAQTPKTSIAVYINGILFESLPGPAAIVGVPNLIEYEITNETASAITDVVVEDSSITNDSTAIDCGEDATTKNRIPTLGAKNAADGSDVMVCLREFQPTSASSVPFTVQVKTGAAGTADASLNAGYQAKAATVDLELTVNGQDADTAPGPSVTVNSLLTFGYVIRNTGAFTLSSVYISHVDDDEGVYDEIACANLGDDEDGDSTIELIEPGQSVNCTFTPRAVAGAFSTTATVVAIPLSEEGEELSTEDGTFEVGDQDALHYTGVTGGGGSGGTTTPTVTPQVTTTGTIGQGGSNALPVVVTASATFLAGFGLWGASRRRRLA